MSEPRTRPRPAGIGWILIVVTVVVVILLGLVSWYSRYPNRFLLRVPSDFELVHGLRGQWTAQWPQIPGPPEDYRHQAQQALALGDLRAAGEWTQKALSLDPDHGPDLARLVGVTAQGRAVITQEQALELVELSDRLRAWPRPGAPRGTCGTGSGAARKRSRPR